GGRLFFFKQKTAYEMLPDWSSDVCSSDLTKARAESIGVRCTVGMMERPERMICLIVGALFDLLEPALWVLAILSNLTALQRILRSEERRVGKECRLRWSRRSSSRVSEEWT